MVLRVLLLALVLALGPVPVLTEVLVFPKKAVLPEPESLLDVEGRPAGLAYPVTAVVLKVVDVLEAPVRLGRFLVPAVEVLDRIQPSELQEQQQWLGELGQVLPL